MYYEFYLDLYFVENLIMNYLVLELTVRILGLQVRIDRKAAAALMGAFGACALVAGPFQENLVIQTAADIGMYFPMAALAFGIRDREQLKQGVTAIFVISLFMGSTWYFLTNVCRFPFGGAMSAGYFFVWSVWRYWKKRKENIEFLYDVTLEKNGRAVCLKGFLDSGNHLRSPFTGRPVHVLEYDTAAKILGEEEQRELEELMKLEQVNAPAGKFFLIPYHTIGNNSGLLPVMEIDRICIKHGENRKSTKGALAAVIRTISGKKGAYQMILHPQILK